jgi:hypothetical protein
VGGLRLDHPEPRDEPALDPRQQRGVVVQAVAAPGGADLDHRQRQPPVHRQHLVHLERPPRPAQVGQAGEVGIAALDPVGAAGGRGHVRDQVAGQPVAHPVEVAAAVRGEERARGAARIVGGHRRA